jgi:deoxyribodipyrimidine photo-lyase
VRPLALAAPDAIGGDPAEPKRAYANTALADGTARATAHFSLPPERLAEAALEDELRAFAAHHRLSQILTPFAPVGPVAARLARIATALARDHVRLVPVRRAWDARAFPHATRGFFAFRAIIPELLA